MIDSMILAMLCGDPNNPLDYEIGGVNSRECFYKGKFIGTIEVHRVGYDLHISYQPIPIAKTLVLNFNPEVPIKGKER